MQKKQCIIAFFDNILLKSTKIRTKSTMNICTRKEKFRYEKKFYFIYFNVFAGIRV